MGAAVREAHGDLPIGGDDIVDSEVHSAERSTCGRAKHLLVGHEQVGADRFHAGPARDGHSAHSCTSGLLQLCFLRIGRRSARLQLRDAGRIRLITWLHACADRVLGGAFVRLRLQ
jgi:hypothetical protein